MSATVQPVSGSPRYVRERDVAFAPGLLGRPGRLSTTIGRPAERPPAWHVDLGALSRCRMLFSKTGASANARSPNRDGGLESVMDVPAAYDGFCRSHFASVRRLHPDLTWDDACPAYAIALSAHAMLCENLDDECEKLLGQHWEQIRGRSTLDWSRARPLVADGCSALTRLDPLAMHR